MKPPIKYTIYDTMLEEKGMWQVPIDLGGDGIKKTSSIHEIDDIKGGNHWKWGQKYI